MAICTTLLLLASPMRAEAADADLNWQDLVAGRADAAQAPGSRQVTAGHVYQAVRDLVAEINVLREEMAVDEFTPSSEPQLNRAPIHVYMKALEVLDKVAAVQRRFGMPAASMGEVPLREIENSDLLLTVAFMIGELRDIKANLAIERKIEPAPPGGGESHSLVYAGLSDASSLLDAMRGQRMTPDDMYLSVTHVLEEMKLIARKLGVPMRLEMPEVDGTKKPVDIARQVLRATYKAIEMQTRLGMAASSVPNLTLVRVTLAEVHDATNALLAEIVRIKLHLGIHEPRADDGLQLQGMRLEHTFAALLVIVRNLDLISAAEVG